MKAKRIGMHLMITEIVSHESEGNRNRDACIIHSNACLMKKYLSEATNKTET